MRRIERAPTARPQMAVRLPLIVLAVAMVASQAVLALMAGGITHQTATSIGAVAPLVVLAMAPAAAGFVAIPLLARVDANRRALAIMIATGLLMRLVWIGSPAPLEDDFNRYMWDGAVSAAGYDPYAASPERVLATPPPHLQALALAGRDIIERINFPDLTSIYPGTAQFAFALAHFIAPWRLDGLRVVFIVADAIATLFLLQCLRHARRPRMDAALYWCNPLVVLATTATAHVDALLPPLLLGTILAAWQGRARTSATLLGLATGAKLWPVLLLPLLVRHAWARVDRTARTALENFAAPRDRYRVGVEAVGIFAIVASILVLPLLLAVGRADSGLAAYGTAWANNNAIFAWAEDLIETIADERIDIDAGRWLRLGSAVTVVCLALALARQSPVAAPRRMPNALLAAVLLIAAATFYLSPAQFPWYALWFLPFAAAMAFRPLLLASVLLPTYYLSFPLAAMGEEDVFVFGIALLHALPVAAWLASRRFGSRLARTAVAPDGA